MKKCLFSLLLFVFPFFLKSQNFDAVKLEAYLDSLSVNDKFMGSIAIWQNNSLTYTKHIGYANKEMKYLATENTPYRMNGIARIFTVTLILKVAEEGKLSLQDKLDKYFPSISNAATLRIENLINHTSGIEDFTNNLAVNNTTHYNKKSLQSLINKLEVNPIAPKKYNNANYILMAFILEQVYKKSYTELVDKYIIKSLNLKNTSLVIDKGPKKQALVYNYIGQWLESLNLENSIYYGTKSIASTPQDIALFLDALFEGKLLNAANIKDYKFFADTSSIRLVQEEFKKAALKYWAPKIEYADFNTATFLYFPKEKTIIVIGINGLNYNLDYLKNNLIAAVFNQPYKIPEFNRPQVYTGDELQSFVGYFANTEAQMNISIKVDNEQLFLEVEGEAPMVLSSIGIDKFANHLSDIQVDFALDRAYLILKKGDMVFFLNKHFTF